MQSDLTVGQVLKSKGTQFWSVGSSATAYEALELMANRNIGAVLVMESGTLVGMFSERDYARKVILKGKSSKNTQVSEIMSSNPIVIAPDRTISDCMILMTENHVRHLPVILQGTVMGVVSIGDIVNAIISDQKATIQDLESYITVGY